MCIISIEFEVNNLIDFDSEVFGNSVQECHKMLLFNLENIFFAFKWLNTFSHELIDQISRQNWLDVALSIRIKVCGSI